jgi:hypothetical protein
MSSTIEMKAYGYWRWEPALLPLKAMSGQNSMSESLLLPLAVALELGSPHSTRSRVSVW